MFVLFWSNLWRYFFKLNCFKLIGWYNHHNVFPPIRSVCHRFLHCDHRKLHCYYKKLHCDYRKLHCMWLQKIALLFGINRTEINQSQSSNIFMYIIIYVIESLTSHGYKQNEISQELSMGTNIFKKSYYKVLRVFSFKKIKILTRVPL
jgi:hypothetical protein